MSIEKQSDIEQRKFWEMAIETWQASGIPVRQFCRQEGLSEPSFYSWRRKLKKNKPKDKPASSDFVEVYLPGTGSPPLELVLKSGSVLRIGSSTDKELLSRVIGILHEAELC
jgi:transposase-like protein